MKTLHCFIIISADKADVNGIGIENMAMLVHVNEMTVLTLLTPGGALYPIVCVSSVGVCGDSWHTGY